MDSLGCRTDKRRAVETLLNDEEWVKWSDGKIAEQAAVSQNFVSDVRRQLKSDLSSPAAKAAGKPRVGKDGKKRKPLMGVNHPHQRECQPVVDKIKPGL